LRASEPRGRGREERKERERRTPRTAPSSSLPRTAPSSLLLFFSEKKKEEEVDSSTLIFFLFDFFFLPKNETARTVIALVYYTENTKETNEKAKNAEGKPSRRRGRPPKVAKEA
jgi:hypothetical protein